MVIQLCADMHPSCILVNTQIINIQGFYICDRLVFKILFENTKSISFYFSVMFCNKIGFCSSTIIRSSSSSVYFFSPTVKGQGGYRCVSCEPQKELVKLRYVFKFCPSYCYFTHNFIFQSYKNTLCNFVLPKPSTFILPH